MQHVTPRGRTSQIVALPRLAPTADTHARLAKEHADALEWAKDIPRNARTPAQQQAVDDAEAEIAAVTKRAQEECDERNAAVEAAAKVKERAATARALRESSSV